MQIQVTKILSRLVLLFVILVGWAGVSQAQWTGLTNPFPSGFAQHCLQLTDRTIMCHLSKPIEPETLVSSIAAALGRGSS